MGYASMSALPDRNMCACEALAMVVLYLRLQQSKIRHISPATEKL
jgi:hypothetical protein